MKIWRKPLEKGDSSQVSGELKIIKDRCKGCGFCVEFCPKKTLTFSDEFNAKGYHYPEIAPGKNCIMCGLCESLCPEFAIFCLPKKRQAQAKGK